MEYNYSKEWKQPNKIYRVGVWDFTSFMPEGIKLSILITIVVSVLLFIFLGFLTMAKGITFISNLFKNGYLIISVVIGLIVWLFATLKYDNKSFFRFVISRTKYGMKRNTKIDHEDIVAYMDEPIIYSKMKSRK